MKRVARGLVVGGCVVAVAMMMSDGPSALADAEAPAASAPTPDPIPNEAPAAITRLIAQAGAPPASAGRRSAAGTAGNEKRGPAPRGAAQVEPERKPVHRLLQEDPESWRRRLTNPPGRTAPAEMTPELVNEYLLVVSDIDVEMGRRFREMLTVKPEELKSKLRHARRLHDLVRLRQRDPHLYELKLIELKVDKEVHRLGHELRDAHDDGRKEDFARLDPQLRIQLRLQIAMRHQAREDYVCQLQEVVKRLEEELEAERAYLASNGDDIVEERIRSILQGPSTGRRSEVQLKVTVRPPATTAPNGNQ